MISVLDRYIYRSLLFNYGIALASMLSLYVVLDLFVNMDEFTEHGYPTATVIGHIIGYYWPNLFLYFAQLSGAITLFACVSTVARMRKLNEMTAVLASGVSLFRIARPVIIFTVLITGLSVVDTEILIPAVAHRLARDHDDADGLRAYEVLFLQDREALLSARRFHPTEHNLHGLLALYRDSSGALTGVLEADHAVWEPPAVAGAPGRWILDRGRFTRRVRNETEALGPRESKVIEYPRVYESDLSPETIQLRQSEGWFRFLSLRQLRELKQSGTVDTASITRTEHSRHIAPIISIVLVLLGLPFFLDRSPANVLSDTGRCMVVCGLCYVVSFVAQSIRVDTVSALPAWIPIFVFGTLAVVLLDRIKT